MSPYVHWSSVGFMVINTCWQGGLQKQWTGGLVHRANGRERNTLYSYAVQRFANGLSFFFVPCLFVHSKISLDHVVFVVKKKPNFQWTKNVKIQRLSLADSDVFAL